jgi:hypothetical protein
MGTVGDDPISGSDYAPQIAIGAQGAAAIDGRERRPRAALRGGAQRRPRHETTRRAGARTAACAR